MEIVNKAIAQITELFRQMTPAARLTAGLLFVVVVISLVFLMRQQTQVGDELLLGGSEFSQRDIAAMEGAFAKAGLKESQIVGNRIRVPRGKKDVYLKALRDNSAMPDSFFSATEKVLEKDNPFSSNHTRNASMKLAKEKELAKIVESITGYDIASVQYDEAEGSGFPRRKERRAMVAVRGRGTRQLDDEEVKSVRNAVVGAIAGAKQSDVTVLDLNAGRAYPGSESGLPSASDNLYATTKRAFESTYKNKIYERLAMYPGIVVGVNVELDPELKHESSSVKLEPKAVTVETKATEKDTPVFGPQNGGRPGAAPNGVGNSPASVTNVATSPPPAAATENRTETKAITGQQQVLTQRAPLVPNRVTATIDVPTSYFVKVWKEKNPSKDDKDKDKAPDPADLKKLEEETKKNIETAITGLLPPATDGQPVVAVTAFTDLPIPPETKPSVADKATTWFGSNWQTVTTIGFALFSLMFLKSMVKVPPAPVSESSANRDSGAPDLRVVGGEEEEDEEIDPNDDSPEANRRRKFKSAGPNLKAELTDLVKEDPDTAVNILKAWIGDVA